MCKGQTVIEEEYTFTRKVIGFVLMTNVKIRISQKETNAINVDYQNLNQIAKRAIVAIKRIH